MGKFDLYILIAAIAGVGLTIYSVFGKGGLTEQATAAGKWVAENIINPTTAGIQSNPLNVAIIAATGKLQGGDSYYLSDVPATPIGYSPSNWTWVLADGTALGLPAGMTPLEFARQNPNSPIAGQILAEAGESGTVNNWLADVLSSMELRW